MFTKKATKIEENFTLDLTLCSKGQIDAEDFINFCDLLRKHALKLTAWLRYNDCIRPTSVQSIAHFLRCSVTFDKRTTRFYGITLCYFTLKVLSGIPPIFYPQLFRMTWFLDCINPIGAFFKSFSFFRKVILKIYHCNFEKMSAKNFLTFLLSKLLWPFQN